MVAQDRLRETVTGPVTGRATRPLPAWAAAVLAFGSSAAVLLLEVLAARLVAPYVGINLQVNSAIIGIVLGAIALVRGAVAGWPTNTSPPGRSAG
ncbi:hypothetical protein [Kibdelosporangium phytohabitans]|uniref:Uncharacterized protein n=1 Tax=Kibdelosporangium phytohabitans TaxID=860235 RepID=A0A0N9HW27_9PSEU|nr:hypothetical protein [Kibdelosporangium phytohabitans]ALG06176.1 hypothetical protein AOZ06_03885 [Kibdelosporangium phytohabitans]MBE1465727.1 hypothetical protein [Kibdelosporangium phytohabitans]